jgi:hypothetical protein
MLAAFLLALSCAQAQARDNHLAAVARSYTGADLARRVPDALPNPKPESLGPPAGREWWPRANDVSRPTMTVYAPAGATPALRSWCSRRGLPISGHGLGRHGNL